MEIEIIIARNVVKITNSLIENLDYKSCSTKFNPLSTSFGENEILQSRFFKVQSLIFQKIHFVKQPLEQWILLVAAA